jgi:hypothetical protein
MKRCRMSGKMESLLVLVVLVVLAAVLWLGFIQPAGAAVPQQPMVKSLPAQGYTPPSMTVQKENPDEMLLCAEPKDPSATYACRTVGEFRKWVRERPPLIKK